MVGRNLETRGGSVERPISGRLRTNLLMFAGRVGIPNHKRLLYYICTPGKVELSTPASGPVKVSVSEAQITASGHTLGLDGSISLSQEHVLLNSQVRLEFITDWIY